MKTTKAYRQGDIALVKVSKLPTGLKASTVTTLLENGSGGHSHTFQGGTFYPKSGDEYVLGYLKAKSTTLHHPEHSPKGDPIDNGIYEVRKQVEFTHEGLRPVID